MSRLVNRILFSACLVATTAAKRAAALPMRATARSRYFERAVLAGPARDDGVTPRWAAPEPASRRPLRRHDRPLRKRRNARARSRGVRTP